MKNLAIAILVFCTFICAAYPFKCYACGDDKPGKDYTTEQCDKEQKIIECPVYYGGINHTCFKNHVITLDDKEKEFRGCMSKEKCESIKTICEEGTMPVGKLKECEAACCVSDGDTPCNSGFTVSVNMMMIMFAVLCSLKLF